MPPNTRLRGAARGDRHDEQQQRVFKSTRPSQQMTFPGRRRVVRTYGGASMRNSRNSRNSRSSGRHGGMGRVELLSPKQRTLTQIGYVLAAMGDEDDKAEGEGEAGSFWDSEDEQDKERGEAEEADEGEETEVGEEGKDVEETDEETEFGDENANLEAGGGQEQAHNQKEAAPERPQRLPMTQVPTSPIVIRDSDDSDDSDDLEDPKNSIEEDRDLDGRSTAIDSATVPGQGSRRAGVHPVSGVKESQMRKREGRNQSQCSTGPQTPSRPRKVGRGEEEDEDEAEEPAKTTARTLSTTATTMTTPRTVRSEIPSSQPSPFTPMLSLLDRYISPLGQKLRSSPLQHKSQAAREAGDARARQTGRPRDVGGAAADMASAMSTSVRSQKRKRAMSATTSTSVAATRKMVIQDSYSTSDPDSEAETELGSPLGSPSGPPPKSGRWSGARSARMSDSQRSIFRRTPRHALGSIPRSGDSQRSSTRGMPGTSIRRPLEPLPSSEIIKRSRVRVDGGATQPEDEAARGGAIMWDKDVGHGQGRGDDGDSGYTESVGIDWMAHTDEIPDSDEEGGFDPLSPLAPGIRGRYSNLQGQRSQRSQRSQRAGIRPALVTRMDVEVGSVLTDDENETVDMLGTPTPEGRRPIDETEELEDTTEEYKDVEAEEAEDAEDLEDDGDEEDEDREDLEDDKDKESYAGSTSLTGQTQLGHGLESQRLPLETIRRLGPQTDRSDIILTVTPAHAQQLASGTQDGELRPYKIPRTVRRFWFYVGAPVCELQYMAVVAEEGRRVGSSCAENVVCSGQGEDSEVLFAYRLAEVYQLNNPVGLAAMKKNGWVDGPPQRYIYVPPTVVGALLANLRCCLHRRDGAGAGKDDESGLSVSQEIDAQLLCSITDTQMLAAERGTAFMQTTRGAVDRENGYQKDQQDQQDQQDQHRRNEQPPVRPSQVTTSSSSPSGHGCTRRFTQRSSTQASSSGGRIALVDSYVSVDSTQAVLSESLYEEVRQAPQAVILDSEDEND